MLAKSISGAAAAVQPAYIEDVFSTYLYTGNNSTQTITNGIDLSGKGGLVWIKGRSGATGHRLTDTARGATKSLASDGNAAEVTESTGLTAFNGTGFTIGADADYNTNTATYVSWAFRKQAKFFDVVTWAGDGTGNRAIPHSLGSTPGFIQTKHINGTEGWWNHHRSVTSPNANWWRNYGVLNSTSDFLDWGSDSGLYQSPDATNLYIGSYYNTAGKTYVAYLFAHNAGGFGLTGTDNVISCGSYTGTGANNNAITLGYEPQWVLVKNTTAGSGDNWWMLDSMRGLPVLGTNSTALLANSSGAEFSPASLGANILSPTATGFNANGASSATNGSGQTYIYIAIRRGPMKVPTSGTSVFSPIASSSSQGTKQTSGFPVDLQIADHRNAVEACRVFDRLRGFSTVPTNGNAQRLNTNSTDAESADTSMNQYFDNTGFQTGSNYSGISSIFWNFRRAPGFFDVVAYTGTSVARTVNHNLAAVPEMMIVKRRDAVGDWRVYDAATGNTKYHVLNTNGYAATSSTAWNNTTPTSSVFSLGTSSDVNASGSTYIAYLFATCPGVSKVGSYTGTGTTKQIDCGFTGGARFVLIKRTDNNGDWYVWDSARGIVAGNDPYLLLNSTAAEVTGTDYIDTYSAGFEISSTAPAAINANGGTFIFLAIA